MISVSALDKRFKLYDSPADRLKEILFRRSFHQSKVALADVSFRVDSGRTLGVIGQNGAGKSTLLKILNGVLLPDAGSIQVDGRIAGLLELGTGFNPELTGLSNVYTNGALLGMTKGEIDDRLPSILEFSELGDVISHPLKTYSSGMVMRLAFSIAMHAEPECFLIDEALSVGDAHFQQKCIRRIKQHKESGGTIIFVSHDMNAVKVLCDEVVMLDHGRIAMQGSPEDVVNHYNFMIATLDDAGGAVKKDNHAPHAFGVFSAKIGKVSVLGQSTGTSVITAGSPAEIRVQVECVEPVRDLNVGIMIRNAFGQDVYGTTTWKHGKRVSMEGDERCSFSFLMDLNLGVGKYTVSVALSAGENHLESCLEWRDFAASFEVLAGESNDFLGLCRLDPEIRVRQLDG
jgi:lipopolysaccharide transport system ATP-binding protein